MLPKSYSIDQALILSRYVDYRVKKAAEIADDMKRLGEMLKIINKCAENSLPPPLQATSEALKIFKGLSMKKPKGRPFVSVFVKALICGQMEALIFHCGLSQTRASELIAAVHSQDPDKPMDPSGLRKIYGKRENWRRLSLNESLGELSFSITGDPSVAGLLFSDKSRRLLLLACLPDRDPVKQIEAFFNHKIMPPPRRIKTQ